MLPRGMKGLSLNNEYHSYAHGRYAAMRELDDRNADLLLIERTPHTSEWLAVNDRLDRVLVDACLAGPPAKAKKQRACHCKYDSMATSQQVQDFYQNLGQF